MLELINIIKEKFSNRLTSYNQMDSFHTGDGTNEDTNEPDYIKMYFCYYLNSKFKNHYYQKRVVTVLKWLILSKMFYSFILIICTIV